MIMMLYIEQVILQKGKEDSVMYNFIITLKNEVKINFEDIMSIEKNMDLNFLKC